MHEEKKRHYADNRNADPKECIFVDAAGLTLRTHVVFDLPTKDGELECV